MFVDNLLISVLSSEASLRTCLGLTPQLHQVDIHGEEVPSHKTPGLIWELKIDILCIKVAFGSHLLLTVVFVHSWLAFTVCPLGMVGPFLGSQQNFSCSI